MTRCYMLGIWIVGSFGLLSCENKEPKTELAQSAKAENPQLIRENTSEKLLREFPLLALMEKPLWAQLLHQEAVLADAETSNLARDQARQNIQDIATRLRRLHPYSRSEDGISLGEISYRRKTGTFELMARVNDLASRQKGDQEDIELILCTEKGRTHETLFVTTARPLHMEILLHLAGFTKKDTLSRFKLSVLIPGHPPIAIRELLTDKSDNTQLPPLRWEFSGSPFDGLYQPDLTGDLIICWHAHDSVLRVTDERIATNVTRLLAKPHPELEPGMAVKIILTPDLPKQ